MAKPFKTMIYLYFSVKHTTTAPLSGSRFFILYFLLLLSSSPQIIIVTLFPFPVTHHSTAKDRRVVVPSARAYVNIFFAIILTLTVTRKSVWRTRRRRGGGCWLRQSRSRTLRCREVASRKTQSTRPAVIRGVFFLNGSKRIGVYKENRKSEVPFNQHRPPLT